MADYKESTVTGSKWQRAVRVCIENPYNGTPSIMFVEEEAVNLGDKVITNLVANLSCAFDTNNVLHTELYTKLNELYVLLREERDAALVTPEVSGA